MPGLRLRLRLRLAGVWPGHDDAALADNPGRGFGSVSFVQAPSPLDAIARSSRR